MNSKLLRNTRGSDFLYFGEDFDQCKKHINLLFPYLNNNDLQINPDLVDGDEDDEEDRKDVQDATLPELS